MVSMCRVAAISTDAIQLAPSRKKRTAASVSSSKRFL